MKARIKNTDEVVDVKYDYMGEVWISRTGNNTCRRYHERELEFLEGKDIDWEERRYEIAKVMMAAFEKHNNNVSGFRNATEQAQRALECADTLVAELKKGGDK